MGYKFQFVTLAGFHSLNYGMFTLASGYKKRGMSAYAELQEAEFASEAAGYTATKHQREVRLVAAKLGMRPGYKGGQRVWRRSCRCQNLSFIWPKLVTQEAYLAAFAALQGIFWWPSRKC